MSFAAPNKTLLARWMLAASLLSLGGCGDKANTFNAIVQGTVTVEGELLTSGTVAFHPVVGGPVAYGIIHADGSYSLRTGQGDLSDPDGGKVTAGEFIVTVVATGPSTGEDPRGVGGPPVIGPRLTAAKYAGKETSDLRVKVNPGRNVIVLEVERAEPGETLEEELDGDQRSDTEESLQTDEPLPVAKQSVENGDSSKEEEAGVEVKQ